MMEYENKRLKRIEENKRKMKELGVTAHAYESACSMDKKRQKSTKMKSMDVGAGDAEFIPDDLSSEEEDTESIPNVRSLRSQSKKVYASRGENPASSSKSKCSTISMSSMINVQPQARNDKNLQKKVYSEIGQQERAESHKRINMVIGQQEKDNHNNTKKGKDKKLVAPGSLSAYFRMKERRELQSNQIYASPEDFIQLRSNLSSGLQVFGDHSNDMHGLVDENDEFGSSDDDIHEEDKAADPKETEDDMAEIRNELISTEAQLIDQPAVLQKQKRKRGPTMCRDVHGRSIDDRKPIILNELGQPIGPSSSTLDEFSRFLGSLARDSKLAPLNKLNWHQVPNKDQIWEYVKTKYMISEEGKSYVLHSIGVLWRNYKCRIKKKHYKAYNNTKDRWKNRPTTLSKQQFYELLKFWNLKKIQQISEKNTVISECQTDRHTSGPISFARKRHELEKAGNLPPFEAEATLYRETRKRNPERKYKISDEIVERTTIEKIQAQEHRTLSGRCTKKVKGLSKDGMLIPDEFLQPYKTQFMKDTIDEMMKILQQALPSDMFARIAPSIVDPSNDLVNRLSSPGINYINTCQNDGNRDVEENDHDDFEGIEKEIQDED